MKSRNFITLLCIILLMSCNRVEVFNDTASYMSYIKTLKLSNEVNHKSLFYKTSLYPTELIGVNNGVPIDSIAIWYSNNIEIALEITDTSTRRDILDFYAPTDPEYGKILNFYSVGMKDCVWLIADIDTFYPNYLNPVRTYGLLKKNPIVLGFELNKPLREYKDLHFLYYDALFYKEQFTIDLSETDFAKTPKILVK